MLLFRSVKLGKISELIAQQIRESIVSGRMKPGDRLPPERELTERFEASRISVREALKGLEALGLLRIKSGSGAYVAEVSVKPLSRSLSSILRIQQASISDVTEARIILEPSIARLACERITPEEIQSLEENVKEAERIVKSNSPAYLQNIEFHAMIARSIHNPVITSTMTPVFDVLKEMNLEMRGDQSRRVKISGQALVSHKEIMEAFRQKNPQKVYELMLKHIFQNQESLSKITSETSKAARRKDRVVVSRSNKLEISGN